MAKVVKAMTKTEIYTEIAEATELTKAQVKAVFEKIQEIVVKQLSKKNGKVVLPGLLRLNVKKTPAVKGGKKKEHPFRKGEFFITKDKPASVKVKAFPVKGLAEAVKDSAK